MEPPGGQEYGITELVIQHPNNYIIAPTTSDKIFETNSTFHVK